MDREEDGRLRFFSELSEHQISADEFFNVVLLDSLARNFGCRTCSSPTSIRRAASSPGPTGNGAFWPIARGTPTAAASPPMWCAKRSTGGGAGQSDL